MILPDYSMAFWIVAVIVVTFLGISKAGFGTGVVLGTPLMSLTVSVTDAAALLLPILIICDVFSVIHYRTKFSKANVKLTLPGAIAGIALGAVFFGYFQGNQQVLKTGIGCLALAFVCYEAFRAAIEGALKKRQPSRPAGVILGGISGFTSTLAHAGGPPIAMYLLPQKLPRDIFVGTVVIHFSAVNFLKLLPYYYLGLLKVGNLLTILILSPMTYVGVRLGLYLNSRFSDLWFSRVVYTILFLTGVQLVLGKNWVEMIFGS